MLEFSSTEMHIFMPKIKKVVTGLHKLLLFGNVVSLPLEFGSHECVLER